jgi:hypothetical protein
VLDAFASAPKVLPGDDDLISLALKAVGKILDARLRAFEDPFAHFFRVHLVHGPAFLGDNLICRDIVTAFPDGSAYCLLQFDLSPSQKNLRGSSMTPATADAATVYAEARYTPESGLPIRPLKLRFVVLMQVSPAASTPGPLPAHAAQLGVMIAAPDSRSASVRPKPCGLDKHFLARGHHDQPHIRVHLSAFQNLHGLLQVLDAAVGARPEESLMDRRAAHLLDFDDIVDLVRTGDQGLEIRDVQRVHFS